MFGTESLLMILLDIPMVPLPLQRLSHPPPVSLLKCDNFHVLNKPTQGRPPLLLLLLRLLSPLPVR